MDNAVLVSLIYLILLSVSLLFLQRLLQREIQAIFLLITRQPEISMALFSLLFLPGVLLHETSHFLMAHLLGVRTGRFSLIPKKVAGGRIQLGYVETASTDFVRDALIGAAPLIAGGIFVAYAGVSRLELSLLWESLPQGQLEPVRLALGSIIGQPDFWLWFYLTFTISSTMMPSPSDRRAWLPLIFVMVTFSGLVLLLGAGPWLLSQLGTAIKSALDAIILVIASTVLIHMILLLPAWMIRKIVSRISGYQVV
ncbi:MAG: hypothetical protein A2Y88_06930 [Chloroflexi bacterium RBG_13_48_10]|nr:MAG: hypothetical protein A2Y88_06930 [Chloroflexi bacterium RBG_13_48_10]